ncbi:HlyD family efflux transporter periplasmic adaptor subunit [Shewanella sp. A3A]|nr:HlyD family efflux transporter periplasmic adaptor subunit [Shewanella ferrihydritica]
MLTNNVASQEKRNQQQAKSLLNYHQRGINLIVWPIALAFVLFVVWAMLFQMDEVARARGEVIASSRVQIIQSIDGGVIAELNVHEGDKVAPGQVLATLEQTRVDASVAEIESRYYALTARALRLRAEVIGAEKLEFPAIITMQYAEIAEVELALFVQRKIGLTEELRTMQVAVELAREEQTIVQDLVDSGDVSSAEVLRSKDAVNAAEAKLVNRKNKFLEDARLELTKAEDDLGQTEQVLRRKRQELQDSVLVAKVAGVVKNIRVTTVGGVLRAGEELMQIIPIDDELILEVKVPPQDIARVHPGLTASIRLDPFDYTIYGGVDAKVVYVSADTLKEDSPKGEEIYYRVHVVPLQTPVVSTTGRELDMLPGMTAEVSIKTGQRSLMDFLLKPIRKTLTTAFSEK